MVTFSAVGNSKSSILVEGVRDAQGSYMRIISDKGIMILASQVQFYFLGGYIQVPYTYLPFNDSTQAIAYFKKNFWENPNLIYD